MGAKAPARPRLPAITKGDAVAALTTGIANVPDGMASAVLAGVNPVHGIYTLIVGTPLAAAAMSTEGYGAVEPIPRADAVRRALDPHPRES